MANVVVSSNDILCTSAKEWFVNTGEAIEGPPFDSLKDGDTLYIIAHDSELGSGQSFLDSFFNNDFPMANWKAVLIVCSAASMSFGADLLSPAERLANTFNRTIYASRTVVVGSWDVMSRSAHFNGDYIKVEPSTDLVSSMSKLSI